MYHQFAFSINRRKLVSYYLLPFLDTVARIKLNEVALPKGMSRVEISKLRKWMLMVILCIALYLSTVSVSHNFWRHHHRTLLRKETSADIYVKVVQSQSNNEISTKGI